MILLPACFTTGAPEKAGQQSLETGCNCPAGLDEARRASTGAPGRIDGGEITIRVESEPGTLLSMYSPNPVARYIADHDIVEALVRLNPGTGNPEPVLAQSWSLDEETSLYTFELAEGVRWHDGEPFSADDVKFTFDRLLDPAGGAVLRKDFKDVDQVTVVTKNSFTIKLDGPHHDFVESLSWLPILPSHVFGNDAIQSHPAARAPVGTGPFKFGSWKPGRHIELIRNKEYRGSVPSIEKLVYLIVPDRRVALDLFRGGKLDIVPGVGSSRRKKFEGGHTFAFSQSVFEAWIYNTSRPVFSDKATRAAVGSLIDKRAIRCSILDCLAEIVDHPWPPILDGTGGEPVTVPEFSLKRSRELLAESGWEDQDGDGVRERNGVPLSFTLLLPDLGRSQRRAVTLIQHDMSKAGVGVKVLPVSWGVYTDRLRKHSFDASVISVSNRPPFDPEPVFHSLAVETGKNFGMFADWQVDELIGRLSEAHSRESRDSLRAQLSLKLLDEHPVTFNFRPMTNILVRDGIEGVSIKEEWIYEAGLYLIDNFRRVE